MDCPKCGFAMSELDVDCPRCRRGQQASVKPKSAPSAPSEPGKESVGRRVLRLAGLGVGILAVMIFGCVVLCNITDGGKVPQYTATVIRNVVNADGISVMDITVLTASGLEKSKYESIIEDITNKNLAGKNGTIWVFDDAEAEKLQQIPTTTDLTQQQQDYYDKHLRAMGNILLGDIKTTAVY